MKCPNCSYKKSVLVYSVDADSCNLNPGELGTYCTQWMTHHFTIEVSYFAFAIHLEICLRWYFVCDTIGYVCHWLCDLVWHTVFYPKLHSCYVIALNTMYIICFKYSNSIKNCFCYNCVFMYFGFYSTFLVNLVCKKVSLCEISGNIVHFINTDVIMQPAFASCLVYIIFIVARYVPTKPFSVVSEIIVLWITGVLPTKKQQFLDHAHTLF